MGLSLWVAAAFTRALTGPDRSKLRKRVALALLGLVLYGGVRRTAQRCGDWRSDFTLFKSALKVCPDSGKVLLNSGILATRAGNYDLALALEERALELAPGYCEPRFHRASALIGKQRVSEAVRELRASLACPQVASSALQQLNAVYASWVEQAAEQESWVTVMDAWAGVLADPEVQRVEEAAMNWETAAFSVLANPQIDNPGATAKRLLMNAMLKLEQLETDDAGPVDAHPVRQAATEEGLERLIDCLQARFPVMDALGETGGNLTHPRVKTALYAYLADLPRSRCQLRLVDVLGEPYLPRLMPFHSKFINACVQASAGRGIFFLVPSSLPFFSNYGVAPACCRAGSVRVRMCWLFGRVPAPPDPPPTDRAPDTNAPLPAGCKRPTPAIPGCSLPGRRCCRPRAGIKRPWPTSAPRPCSSKTPRAGFWARSRGLGTTSRCRWAGTANRCGREVPWASWRLRMCSWSRG